VLEATQRETGLTPAKARALLGRFLFSGEEAEKPLEVLSGGERRRLSLAILMGNPRPPNVLVLDEPTNHLDLESREALEEALHDFAGALVLVSHDRALLDAVGSRTVAFEDGLLRSHVGGWAEYVRAREEHAAEPTPPPARRRRQPSPGRKASKLDQERLEQEIEKAEAALRALEDELADPASWSGPQASARSAARHEEARRAVELLYERWEAAGA
jgi:ATP-binding cassette subfamily F protein 3